MVIIIALFLLSWLPIHMYRLVTTYVPLLRRHLDAGAQPAPANHTPTPLQALLANCQNSTDKFCIYSVISQAIDQIKLSDAHQGPRHYTLHNPYVFFICYFMSMSSVCYNPIVYFWMHKKFRNEVKQTFSRLFHLGGFIRRQTGRILNSANHRHNATTTASSSSASKGSLRPAESLSARSKKSVKICNEVASRAPLATHEERQRLVAAGRLEAKFEMAPNGRNLRGSVVERAGRPGLRLRANST